MDARLLSRTHYQVDEPAFAEVVVTRCTSPVVSAHTDAVAGRLVKEVRNRGKSFNIAAARYAVDLARGLSLINANNVWVENGHLLNLLADVGDHPWEDETRLTPREILLHLRLFLQTDGAALIYLGKLLLSLGSIPSEGMDWNTTATAMFREIYSAYLEASGSTSDRTGFRQRIQRLEKRGYQGKSGPHQLFLHLQTMKRLGLVDGQNTSSERQFSPSERSRDRLQNLIETIPDIDTLEVVVKERKYVDVASRVFDDKGVRSTLDMEEALRLIVPYYKTVMDTGVAICPLSPLIEAVQIASLADASSLVRYDLVVEMLKEAQTKYIRDIRFHQDRRGQIAFLRLSERFVLEHS